MSTTATGRCLCGEVRYEVSGLSPPLNCHCRYCRRAHGAAFVTVAATARDRFRWTAGEDRVREFRTEVGVRVFCGTCGTRLYSTPHSAPGIVSVITSSLDEEFQRPPTAHLNVESRAPWYEIADALPQHAALPEFAERALAKGAGGDEPAS